MLVDIVRTVILYIAVSIMAYGSNFFRGYLMEVVNSGRNQNTVGHFDQHNSDARKVCGSLARPTVISHNSGANKQNISVTWVAPKFMENHTQYLLRYALDRGHKVIKS